MNKAIVSIAACLAMIVISAISAAAASSPVPSIPGVNLPTLSPPQGTPVLSPTGQSAVTPNAGTRGGTVNGSGTTATLPHPGCPTMFGPFPFTPTGKQVTISGTENAATGTGTGFIAEVCSGTFHFCPFPSMPFLCVDLPTSIPTSFVSLNCVEIRGDTAYASGPTAGGLLLVKVVDPAGTAPDSVGTQVVSNTTVHGPFCGAHKVPVETVTTGDFVVAAA